MNSLLPSPTACRARDNPFAVERVLAIRYEPQGCSWDELLARLESLGYRCAIVGPKGFGKTTLMEDLAAPLAERGFRVHSWRLNTEHPKLRPETSLQLASFDQHDIVLLDGAEQLGRLAWWNFRRRTRRCGGLIVTTHRAGLLPTAIECATSPELLHRIAAQLLATEPDWLAAACRQLFVEHRGNLRDTLRELYDWHAL